MQYAGVDGLLARFQQLDEVLYRQQEVWRAQPFIERSPGWAADYPQLAAWLCGRSLEQAEADHLTPELLDAPAPFAEWVAQLGGLARLEPLAQRAEKDVPLSLEQGVPGRKWQQIKAFSRSLVFSRHDAHWLDWCAGKAYLGRYLAWPHGLLQVVERDGQLCTAAQQLNQQHGIKGRVHCCDALSAAAEPALAAADSWLVLHACGDLHTHLLRQVTQQPVKRLALAPCCYNRMQEAGYQPLSQAGQRAKLKPGRVDLALPLQSTVTAGARDRRLRNQAMAWRLAFDHVQRQSRGVDAYLPVHSVASRWMQQGFAGWCKQVAELKEIELPGNVDWQGLERLGWKRLAEVRNLELVQCLYRRPLEVWLLLDMAIFLQEQGFAVRLGLFCEQELTPRNALILAERD